MIFPELPTEEQAPAISFHVEDVSLDLPDEDRLREWLLSVAQAEEKPVGEVSYIFCSDEHLRGINVEYLNHDYYTDIITFPYDDDAIHGDMFISTERVADNAETNGVSFEHELHRVMVHGVLHLAGYGDKTEAEQVVMRGKEDFYLQRLGDF